MVEFLVILSVPHAITPTCYQATGHDSDTAAMAVAFAIQKELGPTRCDLFPAAVPRYIRDMNRASARTSAWRKELAARVGRGPGGRTVLIDVHSYPADYRDFSGADVVMMVDNMSNLGTFRTLLLSSLIRIFRTGLIQRPETMDIAASSPVPATLLEFSEGITPEVISAMAKRVAWATEMFFDQTANPFGSLSVFPAWPYHEIPTDAGRRTCCVCEKPSAFACGGCLAVAYCCDACQLKDWAVHVSVCCKH